MRSPTRTSWAGLTRAPSQPQGPAPQDYGSCRNAPPIAICRDAAASETVTGDLIGPFVADAGVRLHPRRGFRRRGITFAAERLDDAKAIVARPVLRQLEFRIYAPDGHLETDNGAHHRVT